MKKLYFFIATLLFIVNIGNAQVIFSEDFQNGFQVASWTLSDLDGLTPNVYVAQFTDAWITAPDFDNAADTVAMSTSWYTPAGTSDDWMMSPSINLTSNNALSWEEEAQDADFPDGYEVYVTTAIAGGVPAPSDFTGPNGTRIFSTMEANGGAWLTRTIDLQAAGFSNQAVWFAWRNNSTDKFVLMIDDIMVTETPAFDVSITNPIVPEYTLTPVSQATPIGTEGIINNLGSATVTNVTMEVNVYDGTQANVYAATSSPAVSINPGENATLNVPGYTPTSADLYLVELIAKITDTDSDRSNDTVRYFVGITDSTYARDNGLLAGTLGIGAGGGQNAELGQSFVLNAPDTLTSVSAFIGNARGSLTGQPLNCNIYEVTNQTIGALLGTTETVTIDDSENLLWNLPVSGGSLDLTDVDTFAILVEEGDSNITLGYANAIFTPGTTFINWNGNPNGPGYSNNEDFGSNFFVTYILRANFGSTATCTPTTSSISETACNTYTAPSGAVFTSSGIFMDTITNVGGCDSIITINLTVTTINTMVMTSGDTLTAALSGATSYQWLDCDNGNSPIAGATGQSYVATTSGNYAVVIADNNCRDTSDCINVMTTSISNDPTLRQNIEIFPNPSNGNFTVTLNGATSTELSLKVVDVTGKLIIERVVTNVTNGLKVPVELDLEAGTYFIKVTSDKSIHTKQLLIH